MVSGHRGPLEVIAVRVSARLACVTILARFGRKRSQSVANEVEQVVKYVRLTTKEHGSRKESARGCLERRRSPLDRPVHDHMEGI